MTRRAGGTILPNYRPVGQVRRVEGTRQRIAPPADRIIHPTTTGSRPDPLWNETQRCQSTNREPVAVIRKEVAMRSLLALLTLVCVLALMVDSALPDISGWPLIARAAALVGIISLLGALMVCEHKDEQA